MDKQTVKVGLMGLGTVGTGVVRLIEGHQEDLRNRLVATLPSRKYSFRTRRKNATCLYPLKS